MNKHTGHKNSCHCGLCDYWKRQEELGLTRQRISSKKMRLSEYLDKKIQEIGKNPPDGETKYYRKGLRTAFNIIKASLERGEIQ